MTQFIKVNDTETGQAVRLNVADISLYGASAPKVIPTAYNAILRLRSGGNLKVAETVDDIDGLIDNHRKGAVLSQG